MNILNFIASIASSISARKNKIKNFITKKGLTHTYTKQQHLKWINEGKCQCCGAEPGKFAGICDECRLC